MLLKKIALMWVCTLPLVSVHAFTSYHVSNVQALFSCSKLIATEISYSPIVTEVTFKVVCPSVTQIVVDHGIMIVDDHGGRHHAVDAIGLKFDSIYTLMPNTEMVFIIKFNPVSKVNKALDVIEGGKFTILGLHDADKPVILPHKYAFKNNPKHLTKPIDSKEVVVEGKIHGSSSSILSKRVAVQYVPPKGLGNPSQNYTDIDSAGYFLTKFMMHAPQIVYVYTVNTSGHNRIEGNVFIRPGEKVHLDLYEDLGVKRNIVSGIPSVDSICVFPKFVPNMKYRANLQNGRVTDTGTGVSTAYTPFGIYSYKDQKELLLEEYKRNMIIVDYICWHCGLSPQEKSLYACSFHEHYIDLLLQTELVAANYYNEASTDEGEKIYCSALAIEEYEYLKYLPAEDPTFIYYYSNSSIPSLLLSLPPLRNCESSTPKTDVHWCIKTIKRQRKIIKKITGWNQNSFMAQATLMESFIRFKDVYPNQFNSSRKELYDWMNRMITDTYCNSWLQKISVDNLM